MGTVGKGHQGGEGDALPPFPAEPGFPGKGPGLGWVRKHQPAVMEHSWAGKRFGFSSQDPPGLICSTREYPARAAKAAVPQPAASLRPALRHGAACQNPPHLMGSKLGYSDTATNSSKGNAELEKGEKITVRSPRAVSLMTNRRTQLLRARLFGESRVWQ